MGSFVRMITATGSAACYSVDTTDMVGRAEQLHQTSAVVTAALGRLMTAASIMGAGLKGEDNSVTLRIKADGPVGTVVAVADSHGNVKGCVDNPIVELPLNPYGKLDVSGAVGKNGSLHVMKDLGMKEPYVGMVPLVSGEIAEDLTAYYATSEQTPTVCALGVLVNPNLTVRAAGGFVVQLLPGAVEEDIARLEENVGRLSSVTQMLDEGLTPEQIARRVLEGMEPELLDLRHVEYRCDCNRDRVYKAIASLDRAELRAMIDEDGQAQVCCHFCNHQYLFGRDELEEMISGKNS